MSRFLYSLFLSKKRDIHNSSLSSKLSKYNFTIAYKQNLQPRKYTAPICMHSLNVPVTMPIITEIPKRTEDSSIPIHLPPSTIRTKPTPTPTTNFCAAPTQPDTLFWCIYIIANGYNDYLQIGYNYGNKELEIKKKIADFIQKNPSKFKTTNYKVTKVLMQEIMSELLTSQKETSMNCLLAMSVYFNVNLLILNSTKKLLLEFISNVDASPQDRIESTYVLHKDSYGKYKIQQKIETIETMEQVKSQSLVLENYLKPLKGSSQYKVEDLQNLAIKLGIFETGRKYKKGDLYQLLTDNCQF